MKRVLITGVSGFAGSYLAEQLVLDTNLEIHGTYLTQKSLINIAGIQQKLTLHNINLLDQELVQELVRKIKPQEVYHLAAFPSGAESFKNPALFYQNNINGELFLLESLVNEKLTDTKVLIVASAEEYGFVKSTDLPINEEVQLRPTSPYGVSKITQDFMGLQYYVSYGLQCIRVRPFAHIGPRLSDQFASSAFARKIAEIETNQRQPILTVGNLDAKRDLTDVRDMVKAYILLMKYGQCGEVYNIGQGVSIKTSNILNILLSFTNREIKIESDRNLFRPVDIPELRCDNTKIKAVTGWDPNITIENSLKDLLEYWRDII